MDCNRLRDDRIKIHQDTAASTNSHNCQASQDWITVRQSAASLRQDDLQVRSKVGLCWKFDCSILAPWMRFN